MKHHADIVALTVMVFASWFNANASSVKDTIEISAKYKTLMRTEKGDGKGTMKKEDGKEKGDGNGTTEKGNGKGRAENASLRESFDDTQGGDVPDGEEVIHHKRHHHGKHHHAKHHNGNHLYSETESETDEADTPETTVAGFSTNATVTAVIHRIEANLVYELNIHNTSAPLSKSKVRFAIVSQFFLFGLMGFDRCYMEQWGLGALKLLSFGGFGIWAMVDFIVVFVNMMQSSAAIASLGFVADFGDESQISDSFWVTLLMVFFSTSSAGLIYKILPPDMFKGWSSNDEAADAGADAANAASGEPSAVAEETKEETGAA
jgi:hypothetical protein